nr:MAG TPA: hypothetical protein [Caudoviricetes sp.]
MKMEIQLKMRTEISYMIAESHQLQLLKAKQPLLLLLVR